LPLARVTTIPPRYHPGTVNSMPLSACISQRAVSVRRVGAVKLAQAGFGLHSAHWCDQVEGKCDDNKEVHFVDTISNSAVHK